MPTKPKRPALAARRSVGSTEKPSPLSVTTALTEAASHAERDLHPRGAAVLPDVVEGFLDEADSAMRWEAERPSIRPLIVTSARMPVWLVKAVASVSRVNFTDRPAIAGASSDSRARGGRNPSHGDAPRRCRCCREVAGCRQHRQRREVGTKRPQVTGKGDDVLDRPVVEVEAEPGEAPLGGRDSACSFCALRSSSAWRSSSGLRASAAEVRIVAVTGRDAGPSRTNSAPTVCCQQTTGQAIAPRAPTAGPARG